MEFVQRCPTLLLAAPSLGEELHEVGLLIRSQHEVDAIDLADGRWLQLSIASRHHDKRMRMVAHQAMNNLAALVVGHFGHRASVDQADVGLFAFLTRVHAQLLEHLCEGGCFREIQLTA